MIISRRSRSKLNSFLSWASVLVWMTIIFLFSAQPASVSGANSTGIVAFIVKAVEGLGVVVKGASSNSELLGVLDHLLRKSTHTMVYLVLAILLVNALRTNGIKGKKLYMEAFILCALYAASDEFHQLFVPGRGGMLTDVMIDSSGGVVGLLIYWGVSMRYEKYIKKYS